MEEIHDAGELRQPRAEAREFEEKHPGPEQTPKDKRLEDQPQIVQDVLPALPRIPPAMLWETINLWSLRSSRRGGFLLVGLQRGALETDERVRTEEEFPPAFERGVVRHAIVRPPQFVLTLLEAILDPCSESRPMCTCVKCSKLRRPSGPL